MRFREVEKFLATSGEAPEEASERTSWFECRDISGFLASSVLEDVPIYVSGESLYLYAAFVPEERLTGDWISKGLAWNFPVPAGWGYGYHSDSQGQHTKTIFPPLSGTGSSLFDGAEPLILLRHPEGLGLAYVELNQRFAHITGIHRVEERNAYCRIDDNGDVEDVVIAKRIDSGWICTAKRRVLDFYLGLTDSALVRVFDVIRPPTGLTGGEEHAPSVVADQPRTIFARQTLVSNKSGQVVRGFLRGFQVVRCGLDAEKLSRMLRGEPLAPKQYATFIIYDWKNQRVVEWSADPASLGNYFVKSDLPFETSPGFFRPEVLSKYKQDPDKYQMDVRSVQCRGTWSLRSFDINEEGQVHAYICDLAGLPYSEQLHWKQFNEPPKASISKRAFQTDFEASWDVEPDPLWELKAVLRDFPKTGDGLVVWSTRGTEKEKTLTMIQHVVTDSSKEWRDAVLDLCRVVVDGLETATLRRLAAALNCDDKRLGSLKLLRRILEVRGLDSAAIGEVCDPLDELQVQRSSKSAHGVVTKVPNRSRDDFRARLESIGRSMAQLADLVRHGVLDLKPAKEEGA